MPPAPHDRRHDVLAAAEKGGWSLAEESTKHGAMADVFVRGGDKVICFWARTPWSDARWHGSIVSAADGERQVWSVSGDNGIIAVLRG